MFYLLNLASVLVSFTAVKSSAIKSLVWGFDKIKFDKISVLYTSVTEPLSDTRKRRNLIGSPINIVNTDWFFADPTF